MFRIKLLVGFLMMSFSVRCQVINTFAGNGTNSNSGDGGQAVSAGIYSPSCILFDKQGNCFIGSGLGHKIRKIQVSGIISSYTGTGVGGYNGDGGLADTSRLKQPAGVAIDSLGNLFIADVANHRVRRVDRLTGIITTVAGDGNFGSGGDGGLATGAQLNYPEDICFDKFGNLYICDAFNYKVRKIDPSGVITTVIGTGLSGDSGDGGLASNAQLAFPISIATDENGNIFIADIGTGSSRIRKVDVSTGVISAYAGTGVAAFNGDNIQALAANIVPQDIEFDNFGNLFISDRYNSRIRRIDKQTNIIATVAGDGTEAFMGDGELATQAQINGASRIAFDSCNNLYIGEANQGRIRKVTFNDTCGQTSVSSVIGKNSEVSLYPNPTASLLTIAGNNIASISITNTLGQIVYWQKVSTERTVVDMSVLHVGVYFVTLTDTHGAKVTKKVVKE